MEISYLKRDTIVNIYFPYSQPLTFVSAVPSSWYWQW